jgi:hypothetical protein
MLIIGFVIRTVAGQAAKVGQRLLPYPEVAVKEVAEDALACTWTGPAAAFEEFVRAITEFEAEVLTVLPTFSGDLSVPATRDRKQATESSQP